MDYKFVWKKTFKVFGQALTFSLIRLSSVEWIDQLKHFAIHFAFALFHPYFSAGGALFIEVRDGEQGHMDSWREGFNIFPDFLFRAAGVAAGAYLRWAIIISFLIWSMP